jgi:hypothetical protein
LKRAKLDLFGFLEQKNISAKNIARLKSLCEFPDEDIQQLARIVLDIATVAPRRRKRRGCLHHYHPDLYDRLVQVGIYDEWIETPEYEEDDFMAFFNESGHSGAALDDEDTAYPRDFADYDDLSIPF